MISAPLLLIQHNFKLLLCYSRQISQYKIDLVKIWFENSWTRAEVKLALEKEMLELVEICSIKNIRNMGFGTERIGNYWLIEGIRELTNSVRQTDRGWTDRRVRLWNKRIRLRGLRTGSREIESEVKQEVQLYRGSWGNRTLVWGIRY